MSSITIVNPNAGGIDIGAESLYVAVPDGRDERSLRVFGTYTDDLHALAQWLVKSGVDTVAIESTGVYWIPLCQVLKSYEIDVQLVNAKHVKNVPGRKTDVKDCEWLRDLHMVGLLRGSFIPEDTMVEFRAYMRHRESLIDQRSVHVNHMNKSTVQMNVRLDEVVSDITGVTGLEIMRSIAEGETDPHKLLKHRRKGCKATPEQFVKALTANYRKEHVFTLKQSLALYDAYTEQIERCDKQIEAHLEAVMQKQDDDTPPLPPLGPSSKKNTHSKNAPAAYDARAMLFKLTGGVDLTEIDGLHTSTVQTILSEIGVDMSKWRSEKHFSSWLGVAPKNDITGGKVRRSRTLPGNRRAQQALRMGAQSLLKSNSALGAFGRKLQARKGPEKAIIAVAHKLACIIYQMLKNKQPYRKMTMAEYDKAHLDRERRSVERRAKALGLAVVSA
jgi:transposase